MDLNSLAHGVDPKTGKYLSPEQRKEAFRKSLGKKPRSGYVSGRRGGGSGGGPGGGSGGGDDGGVGGGLSKVYNFGVIEKLVEVKKIADELFKVKQERVRLESKFAETQRISREKNKRKKEESGMESRPSGGKNILSGFASKAAAKVGGGLFGILKAIAEYAILDFISKPENRNMVEGFAKLFMGIFKFFDVYVGTMVKGLLGGFTKLFGGGSILERVFGGLQLIFGIFLFKGFTRILNPLKLIGDIKWALKNASNFKDLFKSLFSKNLAGVGDAIKQIFPKTASIFKKGLQGALQRVFLKVFGKNIFTFLKPFVGQVTKTLVKPLARLVTKVPVVGSLLAIPINMFLGDPIDKAAVKAIGAGLGTFVVGALGSVVPGAGTVLGGIAGGLLGDFLAGWLYDSVIAPLGKTIFGGKKDQPQMNTGGIASGPESGYDVTLHGTEAVIPIDKLKDIALKPYKTVASIIIGSTLAVLKSMGAVGSALSPLALQMFNPFIRVFGISTETFASGLGKGVDLFMSPASAKESEDPSDYLTDKKDPYKPAGGGMGGKRGSGASPSTDGNKTTPTTTSSAAAGSWKPLLDLIASKESGGSYTKLYGGKEKPDLITMTLADVDKFQVQHAKKTGSAAVGRYQFMNVLGQGAAVGLKPTDLFSPENQDKMAIGLIEKKRKVTLDMIKNNPDEAMIRLGMEWAALPMPKTMMGHKGMVSAGQSYYAGDGRNKAHVSVSTMKETFAKMDQGGEIISKRRSSRIGMGEPSENAYDKIVETRSLNMGQFAAGGVLSTNGSKGDVTLSPSTSFSKYLLHHNKPDSDPYNTGAKRIFKSPRDYVIVRDFNNQSLDRGAPVVAGVDGKVVHASGYTVVIADKGGKDRMQFHHFDKITARVGQSVTPSTVIGTQGNKPSGAVHVHLDASPSDHRSWVASQLGGKYDASQSNESESSDSSSDKSTSPSAGGDQPTAPPEPTLDATMLRQLFTILTGKSSGPDTPPPPVPPSSPTPPAPTLPSPVPSKSSSLGSMSNQFTLDKKMSAAHGVSMPSVIVNSPVNYSANTFSSDNLNTMTLSETANLKLL